MSVDSQAEQAGTQVKYRRLTRAGQRPGFSLSGLHQRGSLWLGPDHLLVVDSEGFNESYKRFYYRDIEALAVRRTAIGMILNILGFMIGGLMLLALAGVAAEGGRVFLIFVGGLLVLMAVINTLLGPTCCVVLKSRVQEEVLPGLGRLRRARKKLERLRAEVSEAQGLLEHDDVVELMNKEPVSGESARPPRVEPGALRRASRTVTPVYYHGRVHAILFSLFLLGAVYGVLDFWIPQGVFDRFGFLGWLATVVFLFVALNKQSESTMPHRLKLVVWIAMALYGVLFCLGILLVVLSGASGFSLEPEDGDPLVVTLSVFSVIVDLVLGLLGWRFLREYRRQARTPPPPPPAPAGDSSDETMPRASSAVGSEILPETGDVTPGEPPLRAEEAAPANEDALPGEDSQGGSADVKR